MNIYNELMHRSLSSMHLRQKALVVGALVELVNAVDATHSRRVAENDLVRTDTDDGTVRIEEILNGAALTKADDMGDEPKVGDGGVPRTGERGEGGKEGLIECVGGEVEHGRG